ncbi:MAG: helix-turn-helix domain-containing protein [Verrucomicrobiota bacterium]
MKKELFQELLESIREMKDVKCGKRKPSRIFVVNPKNEAQAARMRLHLSQEKFAALIGVSVATLRNWEQDRRKPAGAAKILLRVAAKHPEVVLSAV